MLSLILATTNLHKVEEIQAYLAAQNLPVQVHPLPFALDVEETGLTFLENARIKAEAALKQFTIEPSPLVRGQGKGRGKPNTWILAEDSGFVVHSLAGADDLVEFPGVRSNRWLTPERRGDLLQQPVSDDPITDTERCLAMWALLERFSQSTPDLSAHYTCAMVALPYLYGQGIETEGQMPLVINPKRVLRGSQGFGYDPMVFPVVDGKPLTQTVAELSTQHKNQLSHRGKALTQLLNKLLTI